MHDVLEQFDRALVGLVGGDGGTSPRTRGTSTRVGSDLG